MADSKKQIGKDEGLNGSHMLMIFVAFFGVIAAVNFTMASYATSGFSGTVVDNSYVASQKFNGWLDAAKHQDQLGWKPDVSRDENGRILISVKDAAGNPLNVRADGEAQHPLGRKDNMPLAFTTVGDGLLRSDASLPEGRWQIYLTIENGDQAMRIREDIG